MRNLVRFLIHVFLALATDIEVYNKDYVPSTGSFVLATNHLGVLDIVMPAYLFGRWDMFIMVADKWKKQAWVRWLGNSLNFLYIDRFNPDLPALRDVITRMKEGKVLVIAPEGTRSRTGALIEAKPGVSYLAAKLGYPIVPAALAGTSDKTLFDNLRHLRKTHVILLASALWLAWRIGAEGTRGWLWAKVVALIAYVVLGTLALKRGRTRGTRIAAFVAALATFGYIVSVAIAKSPLGFLARL
jgi:1-acyl-sn-glycerol-3-phosphate acyltransferase